jgi:hypothetical protein
MSAKPTEQAASDCITAQTWMKSVDADDPAFGRAEAEALDAGAQAYRVVDHFGKSGAKRPDRERALAGAILHFARKLTEQARESMRQELEFAKKCERERFDAKVADWKAAAHAAIDAVKIRP